MKTKNSITMKSHRIEDVEYANEVIEQLLQINKKLRNALINTTKAIKENKKAFETFYKEGFIPATKKYIEQFQKN